MKLIHILSRCVLSSILLTLWAVCLFTISPTPVAANASTSVDAGATAPLCRVGVNLATEGVPISNIAVDPLRLSWYIDYTATISPTRPNGMEYTPVIRLRQTGPNSYATVQSTAQLQAAIASNPGADWIVGNEPDRRKFQDDLEPHVYALAYHDMYELLKSEDPTAQVFAGAIVQPTPIRLQYLDMVLESYFEQFGVAMPVDGWAIHNFILNEASCEHFPATQCWGAEIPPGLDAAEGLRVQASDNDNLDLFKEQIVRFRQWMVNRGYADRPVYLSEYGVLMPDWLGFDDARVNKFMNSTFDYLLTATDPALGDPTDGGRLVQRMAWYSIGDNVNYNGYLFERDESTEPYRISPMGENWVRYVSTITEQIDLYPMRLMVDPPVLSASSTAITLTLKAQIANSGNTLAAHSSVVRFYDGDPDAGGVQIGADQTVALAGCGEDSEVTVQWPDMVFDGSVSGYQLYVSVDPANAVGETDETNNLKSQSLFIVSEQQFLPLVFKPLFAQ